MDQLSLVFFTVFIQAAVGFFITLGLFSFTVRTSRILDKGFLLVWPLFGLALLISLTHLGQPLKAFNVFAGMGHGSELSWEIFASMLFGIFGVVYTTMRWFKKGNLVMHALLLGFASACGLHLILTISRVYTLDGVFAWATVLTPLQFFATALLLGGATASTVVALFQRCPNTLSEDFPCILHIISMAFIIIGLALSLSVFASLLVHVGRGDLPLSIFHISLAGSRVLLAVLGGFLCVLPQMSWARNPACPYAMVGGLALLFMAELAGRIFFYDMYYITGM